MSDERRVVSISSFATFQQFLRENPLVIMKAHSTWCGPCKTIQPHFEAEFNKLPQSATIVYVDIDKAPTISRKYSIRSVPCMISFYNGQPYDVVKGANPEAVTKFFAKIKKHIQV